MPLATAANQLIAEASARVGVRLAPGQDAERVARLLTEFLRRDPPAGVRVDTRVRTATPGWKTAARGPAFDAAAARSPPATALWIAVALGILLAVFQ